MANFVVASDNIDGKEQSRIQKCIEKLEAKGHSCENKGVGPNTIQSYGLTSGASGKTGAFIVGGSDAGMYVDFRDGIKNGYYKYDFMWVVFASDTATTDKWITCNGLANTPLTRAWDDNYSGSNIESVGQTAKAYFEANKQYINYVCGSQGCSFDEIAESLANGGGAATGSSTKEENDEEQWDDSDNFTPHKGKIMEIRPYKQISSVSFDKSYDSPTGTANVGILYNARDYKVLYKGVATKVKLRRTCDKEWSATGLEDPNYEEKEKFFKEHIPTEELLKELGFPNYRKMAKHAGKDVSSSSSTESEESDESSDENTDNNSEDS